MTVRQRWTMVAAVLGSGIVFLDGTVVNVALKKIGQDLPASIVGVLEGQTYVTSGYLATLAALLILAGALADFYGRRRIFTIGLAGFGITSVLCGIAPNLELLVVFRILQGATGALLVPGSLSIITATFEGAARSRAFGIWASATSATTILGPIVGGFLVDTNVLSEARKAKGGNPHVMAWLADHRAELFLSVLVTGEVRRGIERIRLRDRAAAGTLERWLRTLEAEFDDRILPVDAAVADRWGRLMAERTVPVIDGLLAATALVHGLILATRNVRHISPTGVSTVDPFAPPG